MNYREKIVNVIAKELGEKESFIDVLIEIPPGDSLGDFSIPCFKFSKKLDKKPNEVANELKKKIKLDFVDKIEVKGPYLNFFVKKKSVVEVVLKEIFEKKDKYGSGKEKGKTIVMDYSHPNIAKPFGIGHLRSTVIGNSLYKILEYVGYKCVSVNHLGDWGTQFGKLIVAYNKWGDRNKLEKDPIGHLFSIYVKFHTKAKINSDLEDNAREEFKKLEEGNKKSLALWRLFKKLSLDEFKRYYSYLDIDFDSYDGESFYNDKMDGAIKALQKKVKTKISDGALVVDLSKEAMPPFMLKKSDGASTYHTRDLAAAFYRFKRYKADKLLYIVGAPQKLHFKQLFSVLEKFGYSKYKFEHIEFGHFLKMSTREGNIIFLEEVLDKAIKLAKKIICRKNPKLRKRDEVAHMVGIGAVIFGDLWNDRIKDITFAWDKILNFEGETGPYVQYVHARCCSVLKKAKFKENFKNLDYDLLKSKEEIKLVKELGRFGDVVQQAARSYKPSIVARYLLDLGSTFNTFYSKHQIILDNKELSKIRLALVYAVKNVISVGLKLLAIKAPVEM